MTVFMDTFALIAWIHTRDAAHQVVQNYLQAFRGEIVTTEWVLLEFADAMSASRVKPMAIKTVERVRRLAMFNVIGFNSGIYDEGFELFQSRLDKDWSLTDCISFAAMKRHSLTSALTGDHHFEQAGFEAVFKQ